MRTIPIVLILSFLVYGQTLIQEFYFDERDVLIEEEGVRYQNSELSDEVGAPRLPVLPLVFSAPSGAEFESFEVTVLKKKELASNFSIEPAQPPAILSLAPGQIKRVGPREDIYSQDDPYPSSCVKFVGSGNFGHYRTFEFLVYPVQYQPRSGRITLIEKLRLTVKYKNKNFPTASNHPIGSIFANPTPEPRERESGYRYVVITDPPVDTIFARLAEWKTKKGINACVRTKTWIVNNYPGRDHQEKIRNYLKTLSDSGIVYVLLGGDTPIIPCRFAYAMTCSARYHPREDSLPCDLYYADLEGTWDRDNDNIFGEVEDSIDLYPNLIVGRAPVEDIAEAQRFVEKVLHYEKSPPTNFQNRAMFAANILWSNPYTDQGKKKDRMEEESFAPFYTCTKLYQRLGNLSPTAVKSAIRTGQSLLNHDGHGWINLMQAGSGNIYNADFDTLTNDWYHGLFYSIGCWTSAFDFNSISESWVTSLRGGGIAFIGNSSYGWGSPGNPGFGYSDRFDMRFFYELLKLDHSQSGVALNLAKVYYIPFSREKNVYRWHQYQLNLLGDPETSIWTNFPGVLTVNYPASLPLGSGRVMVTVRGANRAVENALVCLRKGNESYGYGYTGSDGTVSIPVSATTSGNFELTVTAKNFLPFETTIPVVTGPYLTLSSLPVNDSLGNNDGVINPQERVYLDLVIKNIGTQPAQNVNFLFRSNDPFITIEDSIEYITLINQNDSLKIDNAFLFRIGSATDGYVIPCELRISHNTGNINFNPGLLAGTPLFSLVSYRLGSPPAMPGDTELVYIRLNNSGFGFGHSSTAKLTSNDPQIVIVLDSLNLGRIAPKSEQEISTPFRIYIQSSCPPSKLVPLPLRLNATDYFKLDTIRFLIGRTGFSDNMESGTGQWTTGGTINLWHLSTYRHHSPTHAWYCGDEATRRYQEGMDCYIETNPFMVEANSELSFWRWFHVPIYGVDGIYVILRRQNGTSDTIDFIGTGGALDEKSIQSNWFKESYSLKRIPPGETIRVRLSFVSDYDGSISEGFYIDDVCAGGITLIMESSAEPLLNQKLFNVATVFKDKVMIRLSSPAPTELSLAIFDVSGRCVHYGIIDKNKTEYLWLGNDNNGKKLPQGVYFILLSGEKICPRVKKLIRL